MATTVEQQLKHNDCGISAVKIIYNLHSLPINRKYIEENIHLTENGSSLHDIKDYLDKHSFRTEFNLLDLNSIKFSPEKLKKYVPCILPIKHSSGQHYVVVEHIKRNKLRILDPAKGQAFNWSFSELMNQAETATANYDYVSNKQFLQQMVTEELTAYDIKPEETEDFNQGDLINKLTYFSYVKENFGFADSVAEKSFLRDLLFNQQLNALPKQFKTLKLRESKLRITAPVVLTVQKPEDVVPSVANFIIPEKKVNPYKKLVSEMKPHHRLWTIYIASALFAAFVGQLTIFSNQILIDHVLPSYNLNILLLFAIGLALFRLFDLTLNVYKNLLAIRLATIFDNYFLTSFIEKLNSFSIRYIHTFSRGDLSERVKDSLKLKTFFLRFFTHIMIDAFVAVYSLVVLFSIHWQATLIVVAVLAIFIVWFFVITPYIRENENRRFMEKSNLFSSIFENIDGLQVIRSLRLEGIFMQRQAPKIKSILAIQRKVRYVSLVNSTVISVVIIGASIGIIYLLSRNAMIMKTITIGQIITFIALSRQVFSSVSGILDENLDLQENEIILNRYFGFNQPQLSVPVAAAHNKLKLYELESIEFRSVSFNYIPHKPLFSNLNILINRGDKIRLVGNNGAGKSTFCKLLSLLYNPDGGEILLNGERSSFYNPSSVRRKILLISNEDILFNDTIGYNITFDYHSSSSEILSLAKEIGLYDFIAENAEGLDFIITEQGRNLSTGQRKKILMMRALLSSAELIIFDETLSGIDKESKDLIEKYLNAQIDRTFIFISHEPVSFIDFTKILSLKNGTIEQLEVEEV